MITTQGLTKRYGRLTVVDSLDLRVEEGDIYGFLGPNGSGKSTTVRMLLGLVFPSAGRMELLGERMPHGAAKTLPHVGALIENPAFWNRMSGRRNLQMLDAAGPGTTRGDRRERVEEVLREVGMDTVDDRAVKAYSLGMKQRLGLAAALLRTPRLLVLDEPTNGLDPAGVREMRDLLGKLNAAGTTVLLSSHQLGEVQSLCTRVGMVSHGRMVVQDSVASLRRPTGKVHVVTSDVNTAVAVLGRSLISRVDEQLTVASSEPERVNQTLVSAGVRVRELVEERRTLEEVFLASTESSVFA
ncbi:MAG TPA: ABC transporter ATP-binding protein [Frankiaceae bacterium]|nr:ABC transporter ATP-binding protein [Frankiaceae bacterium]